MKKSLLSPYLLVSLLVLNFNFVFATSNAFDFSKNHLLKDTLGINKLPIIPIWAKFEALPLVKIVKDKDKDVKYVEDNTVVDCIRYEISSDSKIAITGQETEFKVRLEYISELPIMWRDEDCQKLALKVVFPKGFVQTGGNYEDFVTVTFDENNKSYEFIIKGKFTEPAQDACFMILRGPVGANWETIFIKKKELYVSVLGEKLEFSSKKPEVQTDRIDRNEIEEAFGVAAACAQPTASNKTRCGNGTLALTATGCSGAGAQYKWYANLTRGNALATNATGNFTTPSLSANRSYYVTCTTTACTESTPRKAVAITILKPTITKAPTTAICSGASVTLTALPSGLSYAWTGSNLSSSTIVNPAATPTITSTYNVTVTKDGTSCPALVSASITVNPTPTVPTNPTPNTSRCAGATSVTLSATCVTGTQTWYSVATGGTALTTLTQSPTTTRTYYVSCKTTTCESARITGTVVTIVPIPAAPTAVSANKPSSCSGTAVVLSATCAGASVVNWYNVNSGGTSLGTGTGFTVFPTANVTYRAACQIGTCASTRVATAAISILALPAIPTSVSASASNICTGTTINLLATCASGSAPIWYSTATGGTALSNATPAPVVTTTYYAACKNGTTLCESNRVATAQVIVSAGPDAPSSVSLSANNICLGSSVTLNATCLTGTANWYPELNGGTSLGVGNTLVVSPTSNITYYVSCETGTCKSSKGNTGLVTVNLTPSIPTNVSVTPGTVCVGSTVTLQATCASGTVAWYTTQIGGNALPSNSDSPSVNTTYYASCKNGTSLCESARVATLQINILPVPSIPTNVTVSSESVCLFSYVTINATCISGIVTWYNEPTGGDVIAYGFESYYLTIGTTFYAACEDGDCKSARVSTPFVAIAPGPPAPVITAQGPLTFCQPEGSVILTASECIGGYNIWSNDQISNSITVQFGGNYNARCIVNGCSSNYSNNITTTTIFGPVKPTLTITPNYFTALSGFNLVLNQPKELIGTVTATSSGCGAYNTIWSDGSFNFPFSNNTVTHTFNISNPNVSVLYAKCVSENGCERLSDQYNLVRCTTTPPPTLNVSNTNPNACDIVTFTFSGCDAAFPNPLLNIEDQNGSNYYSLSSNIFTRKIIANGLYKINCSNNSFPSCATDFSNVVSITPNISIPSPFISLFSEKVCSGETLLLKSSGCTNATAMWKDDNNVFIGSGEVIVSPPITRNISFFVTCSINNCEGASASVSVNIAPRPLPPTISNIGSLNICVGQSVTLNSTSCLSGSYLEWNKGGQNSLNGHSTSISVNPTLNETYTAKCLDAFLYTGDSGPPFFSNGCASVESNLLNVSVNGQIPATPLITASKTIFCTGATETLTMSATNCTGTINWTWTNADNSTGTANTTTDLVVTGLTQNRTYKAKCTNGCGISAAFSNEIPIVFNNSNAPIISSLTANTTINIGSTVNIALNVSGATAFNWSGPNTFTNTIQNPVLTNFQAINEGKYIVTASSVGGCTAKAEIIIKVNELCECTTCDAVTEANYSEYPTPTSTTISNDKNYVEERVYLTADATQFAQSISYFDGLGRPVQSVSRNTGADGKDVISFMEYDNFGREVNKYMPYTGTHALTGALPTTVTHKTAQQTFYATLSGKVSDANFAFAKTVYEDSPLNRVLQQGAPGALWQPKPAINTSDNHAVKMIYTTNTIVANPTAMIDKLANDIKRFDINTISSDIEDQQVERLTYAANQLYVNITIDENGNHAAEAKDKMGMVLCKRVQDKANSFIETNYVYDDFGQLRFVFQPMAESSLVAGTLTPLAAASAIKELTFAYNYDERGRMTQKKVPSAAKVEMVYDNRDRLVFTQDAWGRANSRNRWLYTDYDDLNRPLASGYYTQVTTRATLQATLTAGTSPSGAKIILTSNSYDTYVGTDASLFTVGETHGQTNLSNVKGMMTKSVTRIVGIDETNPLWDKLITSISFYDNKARPIKTVSTNHTGGQDISVSKIDFTGRAITSTQITNYVKSTTPSLVTDTRTIQTKSSYDKGGRILTLCQKIDTDNWEQVSKNQYYPLGELKTKGLGCDNSTGSPLALQNVDYEYNIRGWLTDINKIADASMTANKDLFAMKLSYATVNTYDGAEVSNTFFNGNIVKQEWNTLKNLSAGTTPSGIQTYNYKYDKLNRLMEANYTGTLAEGISTTMYNGTQGYDKNGNIGYLKRTTGAGGATIMDQLIYSYNANQLTAVADGGDVTKGFKDKTNAIDYNYDTAGNMVTDANKDLSIAYNHLNLPASITRTNSTTNDGLIKHYYAGATKVRMETYEANGTTLKKAYDYLAGMVYQETVAAGTSTKELDFVGSPEGRALLTKKVLGLTTDPTTGDKFRFEYSLKDHLGNLRVSCRCGEPKRDAQGVIIADGQPGAGIEQLALVQENNVDPWGLDFGNSKEKQNPENITNRFTYNGKETLSDLDLGWNDYGFRLYDASVGRWSAVDLLSEFSFSLTGYRYGFNNPISFTDFLGLWEKTKNGYSTSDKDEIARFFTMQAVDKDQSMQNISNFIEGETNGGGTLSDGSKVLTGIEISVKNTNNGIQYSPDKSTVERTWHEVQGSLTPEALDPRTLNQNIFGYTYPGPDNPKKYNGNDDYSYIPNNPIEYPGIIHDLAYDRKKAKGAMSLFTNTSVIEDDLRFVYQHYALTSNSNLSLKTRFHSYLLGRGLLFCATPKMILQEIKRELIIVGESTSKIQH